MPETDGIYIVKQGDWLAKIALDFGISQWQTIWNHPSNQSLRELRSSPNIIFPGDRVYIPATTKKDLDVITGKKHPFVVRTDPLKLHLQLFDGDKNPRSGISYSLQAGGRTIDATTTAEGMVIQDLNPTLTSAVLTVDNQGVLLSLGHLDPIEEVSGVQARLVNLGYNPGDLDGLDGPKTRHAIRSFQRDCPPLKVDGICGPETRKKLFSVHGC
jgi:hypothetical protein